jgi:hypothetical protein
LRSSGNGRDIFAMVKMSMSHDVLSQPPLLVYPHMLLSNTEAFFNKVNQADAPVLTAKLEDSRCDELRELSSQLEKDFPHLSRGARYLRQLTEPDRHRGPCCNLNFIDAGPRAGLGFGNLQLGRPPPEPKPYKLQVVFHHQVRWCVLFHQWVNRGILKVYICTIRFVLVHDA